MRNDPLLKKKWDLNHKEYVLSYARQYYVLHKDKIRDYKKEWVKKNREKVNHYNLTRYLVKKRVGGSHSLQEWVDLKEKTGNKCMKCGISGESVVLQKDHIKPVSKGGSNNIENIQPLCKSCNCKKYNKYYESTT